MAIMTIMKCKMVTTPEFSENRETNEHYKKPERKGMK